MLKNTSATINTPSIRVHWEGGETSLFLRKEGENFSLLNYEFDKEEIHRICGGRCFYQSLSGCSGDGWLSSYGDLIPVGGYRCDCSQFMGATFLPLNDQWEVSFPFASHRELNEKEVAKYPVVLRDMENLNRLAFVRFDSAFGEVISFFLRGREDDLRSTTLSRELYSFEKERMVTVNLTILGERRSAGEFSPWHFVNRVADIKAACLPNVDENSVRELVGFRRVNGETYRCGLLGGYYVAFEKLEGDPMVAPETHLEDFKSKGWEVVYSNEGNYVAVKTTFQTTKMVAWKVSASSEDIFGTSWFVHRAEYLLDGEYLVGQILKDLAFKVWEREEGKL